MCIERCPHGSGGSGPVRGCLPHDLDIQVAKLKMLKANHVTQQYETEDMIIKHFPQKMAEAQLFIEALSADLPILEAHPVKEDAFSMTILGKTYTERKEAGLALVKACKTMPDPKKPFDVGEYRGFPMQLHFDGAKFRVTMKQNLTYTAELSDDVVGNILRINNALERIPKNLEGQELALKNLQRDLDTAKEEVNRPFPQEAELETKSARLSQLNIELNNDGGAGLPSQEGNEAPEREDANPVMTQGDKPSIRQALKDYNPPAPVASGTEKASEGRKHCEKERGPDGGPLHKGVPGGKGGDRPENGPPGDHESAGVSAENGGGRICGPVGYVQRGGAGEAPALHFQQREPDRPPLQQHTQPLRPGCRRSAPGLYGGLAGYQRTAEEI